MTDPVESNPANATGAIAAALKLFEREIAAIGRGDMDTIEALRPEKEQMLERLDEARDAIEAGLAADGDSAVALRQDIHRLQKLTAESERQLRYLAEAAGEVLAELQRIRDRHSLKGIYGGSGQPVTETNQPGSSRMDKSI